MAAPPPPPTPSPAPSALSALNGTESALLATILALMFTSPLPTGTPDVTFNSTDVVASSNTSDVAVFVDDGEDPLLLPAYDDFLNSSDNCTNDYCVPTAEYYDIVLQHVFPLHYEWGLIAMHSLVFVVGLIGNALVCVAVYRNHSMRTVTNYFIVNLALADFMVILFCLPPTVLWDVTETWFMGTVGCKIVLYMQTVSVAVSVLTLTFISVDRWYAICFPLKFKSTTSRAKTAIIVIWLLALAFDVPELVVLEAVRKDDWSLDTILLTQCVALWRQDAEMTFTIVKSMLLYTCPLVFMSVAYCQIVRVLWRSDNIPGHTETVKYAVSCNNVVPGGGGGGAGPRRATVGGSANVEGHLRSRRKAAKMLVAVVVMFAICYLPVHLINILRYTLNLPQNDATVVISLLSHWLCYANSAVNPIIYNFMSGKFKKEFRRMFGAGRCCYMGRRRARPRHRAAAAFGSTYVCRFTAGGASSCAQQRTEVLPLSGVTAITQLGSASHHRAPAAAARWATADTVIE